MDTHEGNANGSPQELETPRLPAPNKSFPLQANENRSAMVVRPLEHEPGHTIQPISIRAPTFEKEHINVLKLQVIYLSLKHFQHNLKDQQVQIACDNMLAVHYLNKEA